LTPFEFAGRTRKLYPERVAVIDGGSRWTYAQFLDRCDRWSTVLQKLGKRSRITSNAPINAKVRLAANEFD
jgi:fatty-acyl-CoA synthase